MAKSPTLPRLLITDRNALVLLERARVHVSKGRVVYHAADTDLLRRFNLPHANVAILMLGQGTSITQEAMAMLAQEAVLIAFTGTGGTPLHMGTLVTYKATDTFRAMVPVYSSPTGSLAAARSLLEDRADFVERSGKKLSFKHQDQALMGKACQEFRKAIQASDSHATLLAAEGLFAKRVYMANMRSPKLTGFTREPGSPKGALGPLNAMIDHGNYLAYGVAGAAIWALGIPPHMSVMHGKTRAGGLVFDVADSWKDGIVVPAAVESFLGGSDEADFRNRVVNAVEDLGMIGSSIASIHKMIDKGLKACGQHPVDLHFESSKKTT